MSQQLKRASARDFFLAQTAFGQFSRICTVHPFFVSCQAVKNSLGFEDMDRFSCCKNNNNEQLSGSRSAAKRVYSLAYPTTELSSLGSELLIVNSVFQHG